MAIVTQEQAEQIMKPPDYFEIYRTIFLVAGVMFLMFFLFRTPGGGVFSGNATGATPYNVTISSLGTMGAVNGSFSVGASSQYGVRLTQGMIAANGSGGDYNVTLGWLRIASMKAFLYVAAPTIPAGGEMNISALYRSDSPIPNANCQVTTPDGTFSMAQATGGNYTYTPPSHRVGINQYNLTCAKTGYASLASAGSYIINGTWWDTWWQYRISLNVTSESEVNYTPVWANVTTNGHVTNCTREVRVLASINGTEIPSWVTPGGNGAPDYCLVFFQANLSAGNNTFYVYYGNSSLDPPNYQQYPNLWLANLTLGNVTFRSDGYAVDLGQSIAGVKLNETNFTIFNGTQYLNFTNYFYLDNDNYTIANGAIDFYLPIGANYSLFYNTSFGWRNITELNLTGQGNWSLNQSNYTNFLNRLQLNFSLAGGDGLDFGIRDSAEGGSYWLAPSGLYGKINLTNDFLTAELNESDFRLWNYTGGLLYNFSFSSSALVNGVNFTGVYGTGTNNKTVYFYDWQSQSWKMWQAGVSNSTHGVPNWLLPQNKQEFKWLYFFNRSGWPQVNVTFLMTAHDPFVRVFVDSSNQTLGAHNISIQVSPMASNYSNLKVNGAYTEYNNATVSFSSTASYIDKSIFFYERPSSMANQTVLFSAANWQPSSSIVRNVTISTSNLTLSGKYDLLTYNYSLSQPAGFLFALGYTLPTNTSMGVGNWTLGTGTESLERVVNSTLTYYDILTWNSTPIPGGTTQHNVTFAFRYNSTYLDDFQTGSLNYTGIENSSQFSAGTFVNNRTMGGRQHRILNVGQNQQLSFNLTDNDDRSQIEYDQRKLALQVSVLNPANVSILREESIIFSPTYSSPFQDTSPIAIGSQVRWNVTILQGPGLAVGNCAYTSLPSDRVAGSEKIVNVTTGENMTFSVSGNSASWRCYFNETSRFTLQFNTSAPTSSETNWAQNMGQNSTVTLQRINKTFTITNPSSSLTYSSIQWAATNDCPTDFGCSSMSGTLSSVSASSSSPQYPSGTGDIITESQTNWAQNSTLNSTATLQYINTTIRLLNNGSIGFSSIYYAVGNCPTDFGCSGYPQYNWTVPTAGNVTVFNASGDIITESQTNWGQNLTANSTYQFQKLNTTIRLLNNGTIGFTLVYFAPPQACHANFTCAGFPQYNYTVPAAGNITLFDSIGNITTYSETAMQNSSGRTFKNVTINNTASDLSFASIWANTTIPDTRIYSPSLKAYNGSGNGTIVDITPANRTTTCNSTLPQFGVFNYSGFVWLSCSQDLDNNNRTDYFRWSIPSMSSWVIEAGGALFPDGSACSSADVCAGGYCTSGACASSPPTTPTTTTGGGGAVSGGGAGGTGIAALPPTLQSRAYSQTEITLPATEATVPRVLLLIQPEFTEAIDYGETLAATSAAAAQMEVKRTILPATLKSDITLSVRNTGSSPLKRFVVVENVSKSVAPDLSLLSDFKPRIYDRVVEKDPAVLWDFADGLPPASNLTISYSVKGFAEVSSYLPPIISFPVFRPAYPFKVFPAAIESKFYQGEYSFVTLDFSNFLNRPLTIDLSLEGDIWDLVSFEKARVTLGPGGAGYAQLKLYALPNAKPAAYKGAILVKAEGLTTRLQTTIIVSTKSEELLDVKADILEKSIRQGAPLRFKLEVYNLGKTSRVDITGSYVVRDWTGKDVVKKEETLAVETSLSHMKEIALPAGIKAGKYSLQVVEVYAGRSASSTDFFEVVGAPAGGPSVTAFGVFAALVLAAIVLFALQKFGFRPLYGRKYPSKIVGRLPAQAGVSIGRLADTSIAASFALRDLSNHMLITGGTGSGKTMAAMVLAEEALLKGMPVVVFDPTGEWTGFVKPAKGAQLRSYGKFGMKPEESRRGFTENMVHVTGPSMDFPCGLIRGGEITVFCMEHLKPDEFGKFASRGMDSLLAAKFSGTPGGVKLLVIFDGVGWGAVERACAIARERGIGMILVSQTIDDFKKSIKAMVGTEVQFRTSAEGDIKSAGLKYGKEFGRALPRLQTGFAMIQNSDYNGGKPWFVHFRPTLHDPGKLSPDDMRKLDALNARASECVEVIRKLRAKGARVRDIEEELERARDRLGHGRFAECGVYLDSVEEKLRLAKQI